MTSNVGGEHLDAVRRRVCSSDALNGNGGGESRKVSMPTAGQPTKRYLPYSEVCAGRVYERSRYTSAQYTLRLLADFPRFIQPTPMC